MKLTGKAGRWARNGYQLCVAIRDMNGRIVGIQFRRLDDSEPRFLTLGSSSDGLFGQSQNVKGRSIVVVEGLTDFLMASARLAKRNDYCVLGVAGANATQALQDLPPSAKVVIAFDADDAGDRGAERAGTILAEGGSKVFRARPTGGAKDLCDFKKNGGSISKLVDMAKLVAEAASWDEPTPLQDGKVPPFPTRSFPTWLKAFVEGQAKATQVSVDLPAMLVLAVCAASIARKVEVQINPGWREPVNLFVVVALPPAERKSVNFRDTTAPLAEHERAESERLKPMVQAAESRHSILQQKLKHAEKLAASSAGKKQRDAEKQAARYTRELARTRLPVLPRLVADDVTGEKLASLLVEQDGKLAVLSPEGGVFSIMAGRYSGGIPFFDIYLKGHAGDRLRVDRVNRKTEFVDRLALTLGLAVQPDVLHRLAEAAGVRERGLLARFLYSIPGSRLGSRDTDPPSLAIEVREAYEAGIRSMLTLSVPCGGSDPALHLLSFETEAVARFQKFEQWLEPQLGEFGSLGAIADWAGAVARLSGILHVAEHVGDLSALPSAIQRSTVKAAIRIARYLVAHAKRAFGEMGMDPAVRQASKVLRWIERNAKDHFTTRELFEGVKGSIRTVTALEPSLALLAEHGFIRKDPRPRGRGRPSEFFSVNPHVLSKPSQYSQKESPQYSANIAKRKRHKEKRRSDRTKVRS
jgi:hypothetical protein